jgi:putative chitinase
MKKIKEFQKTNGLIDDGIIGKKTIGKLKEVLGIDSNIHLIHFMAQCEHESGGFNADTENMNYSAKGLLATFRKYFEDYDHCVQYERQPERIGSRVYANRMGNGNEMTKEGYVFRGRGAIQLTGKNNYKAFALYMNDPKIVHNPAVVAKKYFFESALFFFEKNNLFDICTDIKEDTIKKLTRRINGGYNGLQHRIELTDKYYKLLNK